MLSLLSLNVRGLKNNIKPKAIFLYCKEQKVNCFFFFCKKLILNVRTHVFGNFSGGTLPISAMVHLIQLGL